MPQARKGSVVTWEEPPAGGRSGKFDADAALDELRDNPNQWGVVATDISDSYAHNSGLAKKLREAGCELKTAKVGTVRKLYARYPSRRAVRR